jgi:hypothetical protein
MPQLGLVSTISRQEGLDVQFRIPFNAIAIVGFQTGVLDRQDRHVIGQEKALVAIDFG